MPKKPKTHRPKNAPTRKEQNAFYDRRRADDWIRRLYYTTRWQALRLMILARDPFCKRCERSGIATPSDTVNHIDRARKTPERFFDEDNLEGVCAPCHSGEIQREERRAEKS